MPILPLRETHIPRRGQSYDRRVILSFVLCLLGKLQSFHGLPPAGMSVAVVARTESNPSKPSCPRSSYHFRSAACGVYARSRPLQSKADQLPYLFHLGIPISRTYIGVHIVHARRTTPDIVRRLKLMSESFSPLTWSCRCYLTGLHWSAALSDTRPRLYSSKYEQRPVCKVICLQSTRRVGKTRQTEPASTSWLKGCSLAVLRSYEVPAKCIATPVE